MSDTNYPIMGGGFLPEDDSPDFWGFEDKLRPKMKAENIVTDAEVDLRPFTSPRHNQRHSSSCVAQATVKALEIQRILKYGKDAHVDLSRLAVYYLARNLMFPPQTNDDGGTFIRLACDVLRRYGVCTEEDWPFNLEKVYTPPSWMAMRKAYVHKIDSFYTIRARGADRVESVILALAAGCPVVFGAAVGQNWGSYRSFITGHEEPLRPPKDITGWHATVILGWKDGQFIGENSWGCYDDATEVLTECGWVKFRELKGGESFATLNTSSHHLEFQEAQHLHEYDYEGELHSFSGRGVDLLVTPNHRMYLNNHHNVGKTDWPIIRADSIKTKRICFKKDALWDREPIDTFDVGGVSVDANDWLAFMGYFISKGYTSMNRVKRRRKRRKKYRVIKSDPTVMHRSHSGQFASTPDPHPRTKMYVIQESYSETYRTVGLDQNCGPIADKMRECLERLPFRFSCQVRDGKTHFTHTAKRLHSVLAPLGKAPQKYIPRELLECSQEQCRILLDTLVDGDGSRRDGGDDWVVYYTSSSRLADDVQELALRCGYAADIGVVDRRNDAQCINNHNHLEYSVSIKKKCKTPELRYEHTGIPYKGKVYCVTVPNGLIYVRRNGKAVWCGNSSWGHDGFYYMSPEYIASDDHVHDFWVMTAPWQSFTQSKGAE